MSEECLPIHTIIAMINRLDEQNRHDQFTRFLQVFITRNGFGLEDFLKELTLKAAIDNRKVVIRSILSAYKRLNENKKFETIDDRKMRLNEAIAEISELKQNARSITENIQIRHKANELESLLNQLKLESKVAKDRGFKLKSDYLKSKNITKIEKRMTTMEMDMITLIDQLSNIIWNKFNQGNQTKNSNL